MVRTILPGKVSTVIADFISGQAFFCFAAVAEVGQKHPPVA